MKKELIKKLETKLNQVREKLAETDINIINYEYYTNLLVIDEKLSMLIDFLRRTK